MKNLSIILSKLQKELKAPKSQFNKFGNYKYRNCEDILEALKPILPEGIFVKIEDDIISVGSRIYVKSIAIISDGENSISNTAMAREPENKKGMDESQITGAASSYARKYALNGLFLIDDTRDADSHDNTPKPENKVINKQPEVQKTFVKKDGVNLSNASSNADLLSLKKDEEYLIECAVDFNNKDLAKNLGFTYNPSLTHLDKSNKPITYFSKKENKEVIKKGKWIKVVSKEGLKELADKNLNVKFNLILDAKKVEEEKPKVE